MDGAENTRRTQLHNLPIPDGIEILNIGQIILRFENRSTFDVGSLCYLRRSECYQNIRKTETGKNVDPSSYSPNRAERIRQFVKYISEMIRYGGFRTDTVITKVKYFFSFVNWADQNDHSSALDDVENARSSIRAYFAFIRSRVVRSEITLNTGARIQSAVASILNDLLEINDISAGLATLYPNPASKNSTLPPGEDAQGKVLSICYSLFDGLSNLVLDNKEYPYPIKLPTYLGLPDDKLWIFPTTTWFQMPMVDTESRWSSGYNFAEGRLATLDEVQDANYPRDVVDNSRRQLHAANRNNHHPRRRQAAMNALNFYLVIFVADTGMNSAQVANLIWSADSEIKNDHQSFRTVKCRAGGKVVTFELPARAMPAFRKYLRLREYILNGVRSELLFFKRGANNLGEPVAIRNLLSTTYLTLQRIDPTLERILSRKWRAAKSDWLLRHTDPATTALLLQNTEKTVLESYAEGSVTAHFTEMGNFLDQITHAVIPSRPLERNEVKRTVGLCASFGEPIKIEKAVPVELDCKSTEGCLFCDKFRIHVDEVDIRKLLSYRYCLRQSSRFDDSNEEIAKLVRPIGQRIKALLSEMAKRSPALLSKVTKEVDEDGELDPYWARKLEMLIELGIAA